VTCPDGVLYGQLFYGDCSKTWYYFKYHVRKKRHVNYYCAESTDFAKVDEYGRIKKGV